MSTRPIIEFSHADITNGEMVVVENFNFSLMPGEFVYLTGKVGSGKTSIIRTIIGENPLEDGAAESNGHVCFSDEPVQKQLVRTGCLNLRSK